MAVDPELEASLQPLLKKLTDELATGGGTQGPPGPSAYEVAVAEGFVGDEAAWLASLVGANGGDGPPGDDGGDGESAYDIAVANGFIGTEAEWLDFLIGETGETGQAGSNGQDGEGVPTGGTTAQLLAKASATDFDTEWVDAPAAGGGSGLIILNIHSDASANVTLTNQAVAEQFLGNSNRNITKIDLTDMTECRLVSRVVTASASVNTPRLKLQFHTSFTTTVATYSPIGSTEVATSLAAVGVIDSGWIALVAGAQADVFVAVVQEGGDAAADPALGQVAAHFR